MPRATHVIGHGIDLVEVDRIADLLERHGVQFTARCFTEDEQAYAEAARTHRAERYAARFACKEAVLKALGSGWRYGIGWRDVAVVRQPSGQPGVRLTGRCQTLAHTLGVVGWHVSLTHTRGFGASAGGLAMASAIACGNGSVPT